MPPQISWKLSRISEMGKVLPQSVNQIIDALVGKTAVAMVAVKTKVYSDVGTDTTTNTAYEDFLNLSVSVVVDYTSNILLLLTIGDITHSAVNGECYAIINWNGSDETGSEIHVKVATPSDILVMSGAGSVLKASVAAGTYVLKGRIKIAVAGTGTYTNATISAIMVPT